LGKTKIGGVVDVGSFPTSGFPQLKKSFCKEILSLRDSIYLLGKRIRRVSERRLYLIYGDRILSKRIGKIEASREKKRTAFLCSERFSWNRHRRWISDQLIQEDGKGFTL